MKVRASDTENTIMSDIAFPALPQGHQRNLLRYVLLCVIALALIGTAGFFAYRALATPDLNAPAPTNPAIEQQWGLRISQIGVSGDHGLIDFRFQVLDQDKALNLLQDDNNLPVLIAENTGAIINVSAGMAHRHDLVTGHTYFLIYRNTNGAIKRGTPVTVIFPGDLKIEHIIAK
jgi:hypothetical protein